MTTRGRGPWATGLRVAHGAVEIIYIYPSFGDTTTGSRFSFLLLLLQVLTSLRSHYKTASSNSLSTIVLWETDRQTDTDREERQPEEREREGERDRQGETETERGREIPTDRKREGETDRQIDRVCGERERDRQTDTVSKLVFYAQSTSMVISGRDRHRERQRHRESEMGGGGGGGFHRRSNQCSNHWHFITLIKSIYSVLDNLESDAQLINPQSLTKKWSSPDAYSGTFLLFFIVKIK